VQAGIIRVHKNPHLGERFTKRAGENVAIKYVKIIDRDSRA